jgi:hypothetical protein
VEKIIAVAMKYIEEAKTEGFGSLSLSLSLVSRLFLVHLLFVDSTICEIHAALTFL